MSEKPLSHVRILEFGGYISGPYGTSLLCSLGAEVVKIERVELGDEFRRRDDDKSPYWRQYNVGKRSVSLDLKKPEAIELVKALLPKFDVIVENMRPGKMDALGLSAQTCREINPNLIYMSVTGFGSSGPLAHRPAYDTIGQAFGGLLSLVGDGGGAGLAGTIFADLATGISTAMGVLAALVGRDAGKGATRVETSLIESVSLLTADALSQFAAVGESPARESRHPQAQNFCVRTATGDYISVHLSSVDKFWHALCRALGREDLGNDSRFHLFREREKNYFELVPIVEAEFLTRSTAEWETRLSAEDVPYAPVLTMQTFMEHEQTKHLELFEPERDGMSVLRPPWRFDGARSRRIEPAPRVGAHSVSLAREAYDDKRIGELIAKGVLWAPPEEDR